MPSSPDSLLQEIFPRGCVTLKRGPVKPAPPTTRWMPGLWSFQPWTCAAWVGCIFRNLGNHAEDRGRTQPADLDHSAKKKHSRCA
jgi:hypothetical protein